jgi:hypothetical protein
MPTGAFDPTTPDPSTQAVLGPSIRLGPPVDWVGATYGLSGEPILRTDQASLRFRRGGRPFDPARWPTARSGRSS